MSSPKEFEEMMRRALDGRGMDYVMHRKDKRYHFIVNKRELYHLTWDDSCDQEVADELAYQMDW